MCNLNDLFVRIHCNAIALEMSGDNGSRVHNTVINKAIATRWCVII
jgi:N-acetylmuramoyl-L-alanine amidase